MKVNVLNAIQDILDRYLIFYAFAIQDIMKSEKKCVKVNKLIN